MRLDLRRECLQRGAEEVPLRPKTFAVLRYLVRHADRLVTKDELLDRVWGDCYVSSMVLKVSISELRKALGDDSRTPRYIRTVHGRGYRFVGQLDVAEEPTADGRRGSLPNRRFCGRQIELRRLARCLDEARRGGRQIVFVSGESGIGKSALVETFLERCRAGNGGLRVARGHCQPFAAAGEDYHPILESLENLGCAEGDGRLGAQLRRYAPSWLARMPSLTPEKEDQGHPAPGPPSLRELAVAIEPLSAQAPWVQVLEDLQWCDPATLDLVLALARRRQPARFLLITTWRRPAGMSGQRVESIHRELVLHGQGLDLPLSGLGPEAVAEYLAARLPPAAAIGAELAEQLWRWTEGHPAYLESLVEAWLREECLFARDGRWQLGARAAEVVPRRPMARVEEELAALLPEERRLVEAASIVGLKLTAPQVAAAVSQEVVEVEERLESLADRGRFLRPVDGAEGRVGYRFRHALEQKLLSRRVPPARRERLEARIALAPQS